MGVCLVDARNGEAQMEERAGAEKVPTLGLGG